MNFILESLSLAYIDLWNISGMSMILILLPLVKKNNHIFVFIAAQYISYVLCSVLVYVGIDVFVSKAVSAFIENNPLTVGIISLISAFSVFAAAVIFFVWILKNKKWFTIIGDDVNSQSIKSVHPAFLVLTALIETIISFPSSFAIFAFTAIVSEKNVPFIVSVIYIALFCTVTFTGELIIYFVATKFNMKKADKIMSFTKKFISIMISVFVPPLLIIAAVWLAFKGTEILFL